MIPDFIVPPVAFSGRTVRGWLAATALTALVAAGCQSTPPEMARPPSPNFTTPPAPVADQTPQTTIRSVPTPPDVLAQKMAQYANRLSAGKPPAPDPSAVNFVDPQELRLGNTSPAQVVPIVQPVMTSTPSTPNVQTAIAAPPRPSIDSARTAADAITTPGGDANHAIEVSIEPRGPLSQGAPVKPLNSGDVLEQQLGQHVADYPRDVWAQFDYQVLQFIHDQPVPQMQPLTPLPMEDRELISAVMDGLSNFRTTLRSDNNMLFSRKIRPLLDLADRLRAESDLNIPTLALCTKVDGFGVYTPIEPARFQAGREEAAVVYCEVENFASQQDDKKIWETRMSQEAVLYTESGLPVWQDKSKGIVDHSRNRRHDFFVTKIIHLPATLTPGHYLLKVTVVDQTANRVAESTMPVQMVAP